MSESIIPELQEQMPANSTPAEASDDVVKLPKGSSKQEIQDRLETSLPLHEESLAAGLEPEQAEFVEDDRDSIQESFQAITESLAKNTGVNEEQALFIRKQSMGLMQAKHDLDREFQSIDWAALEHNDPGLYSMAKLKFQDQYQALQSGYSQIMQGAAAQQQAQARQAEQQRQESEVMLQRLIPAWQDPEVRKREVQHLMSHMQREYGFSRQELDAVEDPRIAKVIRDLALVKQKQKKAQKATKIRANRRKPKAKEPDYMGHGNAAQNKLMSRLLKVM